MNDDRELRRAKLRRVRDIAYRRALGAMPAQVVGALLGVVRELALLDAEDRMAAELERVRAEHAAELELRERDDRTPREIAADLLRRELRFGPRPGAQVRAAADEEGISMRTLRRARADLAVVVTPGRRGGDLWAPAQ